MQLYTLNALADDSLGTTSPQKRGKKKIKQLIDKQTNAKQTSQNPNKQTIKERKKDRKKHTNTPNKQTKQKVAFLPSCTSVPGSFGEFVNMACPCILTWCILYFVYRDAIN